VTTTILITALGVPKPKGSLRHIGHGTLIEHVKGSTIWRETIAHQAFYSIRKIRNNYPHDNPAPGTWEPLQGPIQVEITLTFAKPKSSPKNVETWPVTRYTGDADKHARNVLDALVDGRVMRDDAQVVQCTVRKCYPGQHSDALTEPGAVIRIHTVHTTAHQR